MRAPSRHPARPVLLIVVAMLAAAGWIVRELLQGPAWSLTDTTTLAAVVIAAVAFAVAEEVVVHVELRNNAHSVSLAELALTVSLFFVPTTGLMLARVLGGGLVLVFVRKQRPLKLAFNASLWVLDVAVASLVFQQLGGSLGHGREHIVVPALLAAISAAVLDSVTVSIVITATSHELEFGRVLRFLRTCVLSAVGCATAALVCVPALDDDPLFLVPIVAVGALYLFGFRNFASLRAQHTNVQVMYDFAGQLGRTPHGEQVLTTVLSRVGELLRAERAAAYLNDPHTGRIIVTELEDDGTLTTRNVSLDQVPAVLHTEWGRSEPLVVRAGASDAEGAAILAALGVRDAVLAPIRGEQGLRGVLVIADRLGEVTTFTHEDGLLLQTLASHAAAALANSRLVEQLDHDSLHDSLTGLGNRAMFQERLAHALSSQQRGVAVLLMDLDRFKEVNDTLGHHHGDLLLQEIGARLAQKMHPGDVLARLGGDEFAVLMTGITQADAVATANQLLQALAQPMSLQGVEMEVAASIGVVHVPGGPTDDNDATLLLQRADVAMYSAKQHYTGVHLYEDELDGYSPRRLALASGLRTALEQGQLSLRFQPQARLGSDAVTGVEALVRWEHPLYGEVPPDDFISIAEQTGQIRDLTRLVIDESLAAAAAWAVAGNPLTVSVNLSVRNLLEPDLVDAVRVLLDRHGVPGRRLTLEITESHLMVDPARTADVLRRLAALHVRLSIDDFGTGYSSLSYLKQLPVTEVKIDKSFVLDLADDDEDAAIVEAIIQLAHTLRMEVVAEGVEDQPAQDRLTSMGCDLMQGYHLARPMRNRELLTWLAAHTAAQPHLRIVPGPRAHAETARSARS